MKGLIFLTVFFILIPIAVAEDAPKYNFASTTAAGTIQIEPGETLKVPAIYFFNIYGNRITHVTLSLASAPDNLKVRIEPIIHEIQSNISGTIVTSNENLYVSPSQPVKEVPTVIPEGMTYITLSGVEGNIPVKIAYLNITAPKETPLGSKYPVSIKAVGSWFGQSATLAFSQERSFDFTVEIITHQFTEEIIPPKEDKEPSYLIYLIIVLIALFSIGVGFYAGKKKK